MAPPSLSSKTDSGLIRFPSPVRHELRSSPNDQVYVIQVLNPPQRLGEGEAVPVIYCTDGNATFDVLKAISWALQANASTRKFLLVSIGYLGESPVAGELLRARDMTFEGFPDYLKNAQVPWEGVVAPSEGGPRLGNAAVFADFISQDLIPFIEGTYNVIPGRRTYFGHSVGAGFGLWLMCDRPKLFQSFLLSSPTLEYHLGSASVTHFMQAHMRRSLAGRRIDHPKKVYMSVGGDEDLDELLRAWRFTSSFSRFVKIMTDEFLSEAVEFHHEIFEGEGHSLVWIRSFVSGLRNCVLVDVGE